MARTKFYIFLLQLSWTVSLVAAIQRADLFPYGTEQGDLTLAEGDDETSKVLKLTRPLYFYEAQFSELYVATNGIISAQDLPMEKQYVDDGFPTDFPVIAPFLADLDTSGGRGRIHYRLTEAPGVLTRVGREVRRGFPDAGFTPTHAVVATWEGVAAYEETARAAAPSDRVNTFQAVVAYDEADSYALFLYPEAGLQFYGTRPKESYNVEVELPARAGFSRGEVAFYFFSRTEGPHYSLTSNEQSVKNLYQMSNTGVPGVWLFHIGNRYSFENIVPAAVSGVLSTAPSRGQHEDSPTTEYPEEEYPEEDEAEEDYPLTEEPDLQQPDSSHNVASLPGQARLQPYGGDVPLNSDPQNAANPPALPPGAAPGDRPQHQPRLPSSETGSLPQAQPPQSPESYAQTHPRGGQSAVKVSPGREQGGGLESLPLSPNAHVVDVEEDHVDFDTGIIHYSTDTKETCARFQQQCSQNAVCSDYATGYCCHCRAGFYGNGRHCLPDGAPHRVNGKVSGTVGVGSTQVDLGDIDLHAYVVVGDGRAYTAVSEVPEPAGWALMPVAPLGELFGWLFALELPGSQAGFKITGAEFTRHAEVTFYPGNQRLSIVQTSRGLDENNYLTVSTRLRGNLPLIPPGSTVQMEPFKEIFQFYPSVVTSTSVREYSVVSAERGAEAFSLHTRQNITYRDCRHDNARGPETLQLVVERVFVMYVEEERILRYAITNKIGPVGVEPTEPELVNPCYSGTHDCDTTAQCLPGEGQTYQCQCATGYRGDGRNCYDVDECEEDRGSCGAHARCVNLPGGHRCQCQPGYEFGFDGRTCLDINECLTQRCHADATCFNSLGSFECQCNPGFQGDGVRCLPRGDQRPQTQCEQHRASLQGNGGHDEDQPQLGAFVPQCDEQGQYRSLQCHGSTGHCWCVDNRGQERSGTRTPPGTPPTNCDQPERPERPQTQCEQHASRVQQSSSDGYPVVGAFVPQCDEQGQYRSLQCHGSTGHCWCVDNRGQERSGTRTPPGTPPTNCDQPERPQTQCEQHASRAQQSSSDGYPVVGAFVPQCDEQGQYRSLQCHGSTGHCWCVDNRGQERSGTRTPPGTPPTNCDQPERPQTQCEQHTSRAQQSSSDGFPVLGAFVPQCDEQGQYRSLQCHGSTGHCWCVDNRGQERSGTRTPPGTPPTNCDQPERPQTQCEHHASRAQQSSSDGFPVVGAFVPQCDEQGQYRSLQCHGSTGHCWCVDNRGQERSGTRTPPGTPPTNCDQPGPSSSGHLERPQTQCEQHVSRAQQSSSDGFPVVGAFVPQCDEQGQYRSLQCHGSTGHCWCVDNRGQERSGTRTPPGTPPTNCDQPVDVAPTRRTESVCERWRASLIDHYGGNPAPHHYLPQCDYDGHFNPVQCYGDSSYCWCVDQDGREVEGTRSHDVVKPACVPSVAPPTVRPLPRPDVTPPTAGSTLLYAQGQQIGALPLNGSRMDMKHSRTLLALHGSIVVGLDYDCRERRVYWTDLAGRTISRASMEQGALPETLINTDLTSPEGLAVDSLRRTMFWVDSKPDKIERANLDGSERMVLFNTDLVNPRAIIVDSSTGTLYWTDWNREAPKIESSTVEGHNRRVLVQEGIGLPNALTYDPTSRQVCWADAGTKRLECVSPDGSGRRVIHSNLNYPFSMVYYAGHFYYTDWRRDGVLAVSRDSSLTTDEFLPDQRSHLYGIAVATSQCL